MSYSSPAEEWRLMTIEEREQAYRDECEANRAQWAQWIGLPEDLDKTERDQAIAGFVAFLRRTGSVLDIGDR